MNMRAGIGAHGVTSGLQHTFLGWVKLFAQFAAGYFARLRRCLGCMCRIGYISDNLEISIY